MSSWHSCRCTLGLIRRDGNPFERLKLSFPLFVSWFHFISIESFIGRVIFEYKTTIFFLHEKEKNIFIIGKFVSFWYNNQNIVTLKYLINNSRGWKTKGSILQIFSFVLFEFDDLDRRLLPLGWCIIIIAKMLSNKDACAFLLPINQIPAQDVSLRVRRHNWSSFGRVYARVTRLMWVNQRIHSTFASLWRLNLRDDPNHSNHY